MVTNDIQAVTVLSSSHSPSKVNNSIWSNHRIKENKVMEKLSHITHEKGKGTEGLT